MTTRCRTCKYDMEIMRLQGGDGSVCFKCQLDEAIERAEAAESKLDFAQAYATSYERRAKRAEALVERERRD